MRHEMPNPIGPFEGCSRIIASRVTKLPKTVQPAISGGIFEKFAVVDVVVDKRGFVLSRSEGSLPGILAAMGNNCAVVTIVYIDPEAITREKVREDDIFSELTASRTEKWSEVPELIELVNLNATNAFWALGRVAPVVPEKWTTLGGCILQDGLMTPRDSISPLTTDDIWKLWRGNKWGSPEPADDEQCEIFGERMGGFLQTCGWDTVLGSNPSRN